MKFADERICARFNQYWTPDPNTGCWLWFGARDPRGYGRFNIGGRPKRTVFAHRFSWELTNARHAGEFVIRHKCDTPECVNPEHLVLGTHAENVLDRISRGRSVYVRGQENGKSKLTEQLVREIRRLLGKETGVEIAKRYGLSPCTVADIKHGRTWRHVS